MANRINYRNKKRPIAIYHLKWKGYLICILGAFILTAFMVEKFAHGNPSDVAFIDYIKSFLDFTQDIELFMKEVF